MTENEAKKVNKNALLAQLDRALDYEKVSLIWLSYLTKTFAHLYK